MKKFVGLLVLLLALPVGAANKITWDAYPSATTLTCSGLTTLANGSCVTCDAIDNSTTLDMFINVELFVSQQASARSSGAFVTLRRLDSVDGTNYSDPVAGDNNLVWTWAMDAAVTARYLTAVHIPATGKMKLRVCNNTGQAFSTATSNSSIKYQLQSPEVQ